MFHVVQQEFQIVKIYSIFEFRKRGMYRDRAVYRIMPRCTGLCRVWLIFSMKNSKNRPKKLYPEALLEKKYLHLGYQQFSNKRGGNFWISFFFDIVSISLIYKGFRKIWGGSQVCYFKKSILALYSQLLLIHYFEVRYKLPF